MKLTLDESQRLNIHFIIGQQRGPVDDIRLCWHIQDKIGLSKAEKDAIGYTVTTNNGNTSVYWNSESAKPAEYDFTEEELIRMARAFKDWQPGFLANDRTWLEPLLAQLDNGQPKTESK